MVREYSNRIFDPKLAKMGREDLKAEGSDYDDINRLSFGESGRRGNLSSHGLGSTR